MDDPEGDYDSDSGSDFYATQTPKEQAPDQGQDRTQDQERDTRPDAQNPQSLPVSTTRELLGSTGDLSHGRDDTDNAPVQYTDDGDSSSEMDVSLPSRSSNSSPESTREAHLLAGAKRKLVEEITNGDHGSQPAIQDSNKKRRLSDSLAVDDLPSSAGIAASPLDKPASSAADRCPPALWQQVLLYLPPAMLCRCLRVSKTLNTILTNTQGQPVTKENKNRSRVVDSEALWIQSRKNFMPNMPRPLARFNELEMLQLLGGRTCQSCSKQFSPAPATTAFNAGPGPEGLRVVWPFGIRTCGACFERNTIKDVEILVTAAASLRFGLPYAFRTPDLHFVPEMIRQQPGGIPSHLRVAKVYYKADVESIQHEYTEAKAFGAGAAEEWRKGLATKGKDAMADAARWEKWESQIHFGADLAHVLREYDLSSFPRRVAEVQGRFAGVNGSQAPPVPNGAHVLPQPVYVLQPGYPHLTQAPHPMYQQPPRPLRHPMEVEEARQARKADIERRSMQLIPPLEPNVLQYIESFQAAMQITTPMNDFQWEILRPRLLAQREYAELQEHQRAEQLAALQAALPSVTPDDTFLKPAKEVYDREYEQSQEPLRKKLGEYADEFINGQWHGGQGLDRDSAPGFAIQTLLHVRRRYLEDRQAGTLPTYEQVYHSKQGTPAPEPFLSLDNMKWVYDNKVRTLTDQHRRELFICAGCSEERKPKWFAFEGLIQHYGAKHTTAFSKGNIVVHWQTADWPEDPPFHTQPSLWIKMDRKGSEYKAHGRARGTPQQLSHDVSFMPASPGMLLSENALFATGPQPVPVMSNGFHHAGQGHPPRPQSHAEAYGSQQAYSYGVPTSNEPAAEVGYDAQLTKLCTDAQDFWEALDGVADLLECIRIQTAIHHTAVSFMESFHHRPNVDLLTDALATNPLMRSIKNAHGLACKICVASQTDGSANYQSYYARIRNVKLYNVSSLVTHFKILHQPYEGIGPDWSTDMIELPETQLVSHLIRAPGMDDAKLKLIDEAFPEAFPTPLPKIGVVKEVVVDVGPDSGLANRLLGRLNKKPQQGKKKKGQQGSNGTPVRDASQEPVPEPTEDEYDPRRPMFISKEDPVADAARFDTDIARKTSAPLPVALPFSLAPETLAALNSLNNLTSQAPATEPVRVERSPSVGRTDPASGVPTNGGMPVVQPDIAAILASLTGQQQPAQSTTPPAPSSARPSSVVRHQPTETYGHFQSTPVAHRPVSRQFSGPYAPDSGFRASVEPSAARYAPDPLSDLQAALTRNTRQYEQSQQLPPTYVEQPHQPHPQPRSPPRYRYVYEDDAYNNHPQPQPQPPTIYRQDQGMPAVQYVQLPPSHHPPYQYQPQPPQQPPYHYDPRPPQPKPIYVDEYGRPVELIPIPIDSAPAPVQYAPNPYEQQQQHQQQYQQYAPQQYQPVYYERGEQGQQ